MRKKRIFDYIKSHKSQKSTSNVSIIKVKGTLSYLKWNTCPIMKFAVHKYEHNKLRKC